MNVQSRDARQQRVLCKYNIIYWFHFRAQWYLYECPNSRTRNERVTYVQRFQGTGTLCKEEVVSGAVWSLTVPES